jgi:ankyrin repeat protein
VEYDDILEAMAISKTDAYRHMNSPVTKSDAGRTTLHDAAAQGNIEKVKNIINKSDINLHKRDANGWQAIHEAARAGSIDVVKALTDKGADLSAKTSNGGM